jgi:GntP family gluconate:H+ symporter
MESGAADKIIRRFIAVLGEARAGLALLLCSFVLCAPVFYDTVMLLLLPLARALSLRLGKDYLLYVLVICAGGAISNGVVPPAPGPLFVAESLKLDLGTAIGCGVLFGIPPALGAYAAARWINSRMQVPVREMAGSYAGAIDRIASAPECELPGFFSAITPIVLPVFWIGAASIAGFFRGGIPADVLSVLEVLGNKNVALALGAAAAVALVARQSKDSFQSVTSSLGSCVETAGVIILIVSAGGAYGAMIKHSGVGECVRELFGGSAIPHVLLAWGISAMIRAAQGSATVATITAVGIMQSIAGPEGYGVHPVYILIAIGLGSKFLNWMNDSGFWVVSRFSGLTQGELLRSWTILVSLLSIFGLVEVLVLSSLFPNLWFSVGGGRP